MPCITSLQGGASVVESEQQGQERRREGSDNIPASQEQEQVSNAEDTLLSSISSEDQLQKIGPSIQEKVGKFETEDVKRKPECSPELIKQEKKKLKYQEKYIKKKEQQEKSNRSQIKQV